MAISPLDIARKVISTTLSARANTPTTTKTTKVTDNSVKSSSTTNSSKSNSGQSYAYDPSGNKVNVNIKDGLSYLDNGQRVGAGYTVQTGGGIYKMGNDGKGTKVDSHNQYVNTLVNNTGKSTGGTTSNKAKGDIVNTLSGDARSSNILGTPMKSYTNQYNDALLNIYEKNPVDNSVLAQMFTSDILNRDMPNNKRYGDFAITQEMIDGYDKAYDDTISNMGKRYDGFKDEDKNNIVGQLYADAINRYKEGGSKGNPNLRVQSNVDDLPKNTQYNDLANALVEYNPPNIQSGATPVNTVVPAVNGNNIPVRNTNDFIPLDSSNPDIGGIYQTNQGYAFEYEGNRTMISEQEYIELMETILGF